MKLDRIDIRILHELQKNGRITNVALAELVCLSPTPCLIRVKKLQKAGYISGYSALIEIAKLGPTITVFTEVTLKNHRRHDLELFQRSAEMVDEIIECHLISGGYDFLLKCVTGTISDYQTVIEGLVDQDIGIDRYSSFVVMKTSFSKSHIPLKTIFSEIAG